MLSLFNIHQPHISLMHQRGRLQRVARLLLSHFGRRQLAKLVINERQQLLGRRGVALLNL